VAKVLSFERKLDLFESAVAGGDTLRTSLLSKAILSDLADEQRVFRDDARRGRITTEKDYRPRMAKLRYFAARDFASLGQPSLQPAFKDLLLQLDLMIGKQDDKNSAFHAASVTYASSVLDAYVPLSVRPFQKKPSLISFRSKSQWDIDRSELKSQRFGKRDPKRATRILHKFARPNDLVEEETVFSNNPRFSSLTNKTHIFVAAHRHQLPDEFPLASSQNGAATTPGLVGLSSDELAHVAHQLKDHCDVDNVPCASMN